jgi:hypothetical protein
MGVNYVGIELNKVYFDKEEARFNDYISRGDMFASADLEVSESKEGLF